MPYIDLGDELKSSGKLPRFFKVIEIKTGNRVGMSWTHDEEQPHLIALTNFLNVANGYYSAEDVKLEEIEFDEALEILREITGVM